MANEVRGVGGVAWTEAVVPSGSAAPAKAGANSATGNSSNAEWFCCCLSSSQRPVQAPGERAGWF